MHLSITLYLRILPVLFQVILRSSNLSSLPDRGTRLVISLTEKETKLKKLKEQWQSSNFAAVPGKCNLSNTKVQCTILLQLASVL
jgi:hypothetical protein